MTDTTNDDQSNLARPSDDSNLSVNLGGREEKLRRAKIAMEGLDRTVRREAVEKEEEASTEKQQLNKILSSINHEKELLELTWVNLDDKRTGLKKALAPLLDTEDKIQSEEVELESKEEVTLSPAERRPIEEARWANQEKRHQVEQEKWLVEEKVAKIEQQIIELKDKYQTLINQEEEVRQKIQAIDESLLLQQEVLRQQHELAEQKKRQEILKQREEEKKRAEEATQAEKNRLAPAPEAKAPPTPPVDAAAEALKRVEQLRRQEEEKQKQETARFQAEQATPKTPSETPVAPEKPIMAKPEAKSEKQAAIKRALELERIKQENEEAERARRQPTETPQTTIEAIKAESQSGLTKPLRTLKSDLDAAVKNQQVDATDLDRLNKKTFPWFKQ
ncbi:MAG: hypothetical protein COV08_03585 [Candidatus Vogelbacteria bacterium CG10_big_fil_rev_8_21_14_0_10_49_38]|uniref:Uncharacterized protein n=1 Tax=Candidatus Vogelbacteria bacterium CG10_big_fil_rev_8_21_14_0_10_49_38 TaxID=1975043 RepID=A0A2H0RGY0_9BACT|nr:MAG: hypothetical protein BK006_03575 [bacterium CG10_49_38]PIR45717.1 MAG: hypothetical protein COV08_03585 [Candidatus Vogelbacteria bacterium CG10_big_fil_rev_8_21_14_0_10_49_38]